MRFHAKEPKRAADVALGQLSAAVPAAPAARPDGGVAEGLRQPQAADHRMAKDASSVCWLRGQRVL
eukprot:scaffold89108_cov50-Phaeocystis_antarctica.AAC.2